MKAIAEELESLIFENLLSCKHPTRSSQTSTRYGQEVQDLEFELNKKNRELEKSEIKLKEVEIEIQKKDLVIEGIRKKVKLLRL